MAETPPSSTGEKVILALTALEALFLLLQKLRASAQQAGEWTPEQETEFQSKLDTITSQDHWKIEP